MKKKADCTPEEWEEILKKCREKKRKANCTPEEWEKILTRNRNYKRNLTKEQKIKKLEKDKEYREQNKDKIKERIAEWRRKNPDKVKEYSKKYRNSHQKECRERFKKYYSEHKKENIAHSKQWRKTNKERYDEYRRQRYANMSIEKKKKIKLKRVERYKNEKEVIKEKAKIYRCKTKISFNDWAGRLTVDEKPIADENGFLMVQDYFSKEYFYPTMMQIQNRIRALDGKINGEFHLYKNETTRQLCPIYRSHYDKRTRKTKIKYQIDKYWRETVIERANGHCERCGEASDVLHAHHIIPKGVCGMLEEDFDNGMALCPECHKEVHSTDGCRLHELAAEKRKAS